MVDYFGVAHHLKAALAAYSNEDIEGALVSMKDQIPILRDRHIRVLDIFRRVGLDNLADEETCLNVLATERVRAEFTVKLKDFLKALETVLPRPEGLPFVADAKRLAYIYARARNRFKDMPVIGKDVGAKVRKLIDDHVISLGINPKIPPIQLTDADFAAYIGESTSKRAKASNMEHAIRSHITKNFEQDPVLFKRMSERLSQILESLGAQWDEIIKQLQQLIDELTGGADPVAHGSFAVPAAYMPFLRSIIEAMADGGDPNDADLKLLPTLTVRIVDHITSELQSNPSIWTDILQVACWLT